MLDSKKLQEIKSMVPQYVVRAGISLTEAGFEAYLVGGSVRDLLLGRVPQDYDIATNAYPEEIAALFEKSIPTGAKFGTMIVVVTDENEEAQQIEITTFRSEADYFAGRWPTKVEFTKSIQEDLARRDFTINAIALRINDSEMTMEDLVDPYGGLKDLEERMIKAVGDPVERFTEDGLRPLRACRLAANLDFEIEENTFAAISKTLTIIDNISKERVREELMKLLLKSSKPSIGLDLMSKSGILLRIIPELLEGTGINQPQFHVDDVYTHSLKTVDAAVDDVKLAALFHDIGKPRSRSEDEKGVHFYGHDIVGAEMTKEIMERLKFSRAEIDRTANLVRWHMFYYPSADWRKNTVRANQIMTLKIKLNEGAENINRHDLKLKLFNLIKDGEQVEVLELNSETLNLALEILVQFSLISENPDAKEKIKKNGEVEFNLNPADINYNFLSDSELQEIREMQTHGGANAGWTDGAVRRFIRNVGGPGVVDDLMKLRIADASANPKSVFNPSELQVLAERIASLRAEDMTLKVTDLDLSGHDLMEMGVTEGKEIGKILNYLLERVIDEPKLNDREKLKQLVIERYFKLA